MNVKFKGNYVTLEGTHVKVGHPSPKFVVTDQELNAVESKNFINIFHQKRTPISECSCLISYLICHIKILFNHPVQLLTLFNYFCHFLRHQKPI